MPGYPDRDTVQRILAPFEERIIAVHQRAWKRWEESPHRPIVQFARTAPTLICEFIATEAEIEFPEDGKEVRAFRSQTSVKYLFAEQVVLRFKKGGPKGVALNIPTQAERDYTDPEIAFPDKPDVAKVEVLWFPNKLKTKLDRVAVVARDLGTRIWSYDLGEEATEIPLPLPLPIIPVQPSRRPSLVVIRGGLSEKLTKTDK